MKPKTLFVVLVAAIPSLSFAQSSGAYQCTHGDLTRRVEIYTEPGVTVPCEVHYYKDTEAPGEQQVLWHASSDAAYCETKTTEFIGKLTGWGWSCTHSDEALGNPEPEIGASPVSNPETEAVPDQNSEQSSDDPPFIEDLESDDSGNEQ